MAIAPFSAASGASSRLMAVEAAMKAKSTSASSSGGGEFDLDLLAPELEFLADRTLGGAEANGLQREVALFEDVEKDLSDGACRADYSDAALVQLDILPSARFGKMIAVWGRGYQGRGQIDRVPAWPLYLFSKQSQSVL